MVTGLGVLGAVAAGPEDLTVALRSGRCALSTPSPPADADRPGVSWPAFTADLAADDVPDRALDSCPACPTPCAAQPADRAAGAGPGTGGRRRRAPGMAGGQGSDRTAPPPERIGVTVAGNNLTERVTEDGRARAERNPAHLPARYALQHQDTDHVATLSRVLGLRGEGCTVGGASASGNLALVHGAGCSPPGPPTCASSWAP
ncbi:hypothetical protein SVIOM342S_10171 [Streptomyces violaceorubidus]